MGSFFRSAIEVSWLVWAKVLVVAIASLFSNGVIALIAMFRVE